MIIRMDMTPSSKTKNRFYGIQQLFNGLTYEFAWRLEHETLYADFSLDEQLGGASTRIVSVGRVKISKILEVISSRDLKLAIEYALSPTEHSREEINSFANLIDSFMWERYNTPQDATSWNNIYNKARRAGI